MFFYFLIIYSVDIIQFNRFLYDYLVIIKKMKIIVCIDINGGMAFNQRRQSQDKKLRERILNIINGNKLMMNDYSYKQFGDVPQIIVDNKFLENSTHDDFCFVEDIDVAPYVSKIDKIILYHWNRSYPSDLKFTISLDKGWKLISKEDFKGSSHENISEEVYERE